VADPFVAEIRIFGFTFAPKGWAFCAGQLLPISQNTALFALLGTMYGGDGKSTFGLPDMQGNAPMFFGQGQGLSLYDEGQMGGVDFVTLLDSEMPIHQHALQANTTAADLPTPAPNRSMARSAPFIYKTPNGPPPAAAPQPMAQQAVSIAGGSQPHNNMMPYLTLNFCIALQGVFPPRP
jgi:microcystin-dependent protein